MGKKGETGTPGGRSPFEVTNEVIEEVESLAATGLNLKEIALALGISYDTLNEKKKVLPGLSRAIEIGRAKSVVVIKNKFFEKAKDGDNHCMTLYLKNYSDLTDRHDIKHSGAFNVNMQVEDAATL